MRDIEANARREISRLDEIFENIEVLRANRVYELATCYYRDAKHFLRSRRYVEAFEAAVISWAYIDALFHFRMLKAQNDKIKKYFTYFEK